MLGMGYNYMKRCPVCDDGKQLGQFHTCPIHKQATWQATIVIPLKVKQAFVDPSMA